MSLHRQVPDFPIAPLLEYLGFVNVPRVTAGHAKVRCDFHGDRTPSASVSQYGFRCWACGRSGDALKLLREEEDLSFVDAIERLKGITGVEDPGVPRGTGWGEELSLE